MSEEKTMVDVADKTVEHLANGAERLTNLAVSGAEKAAHALEVAVQKAGPIAEQGWQMAVAHEFATALSSVVMSAVIIATTIVLLVVFFRVVRASKDKDAEEFLVFLRVVSCVVTLVITIWQGSSLKESLPNVFVPEYNAATKLFGMVKR